MKTLLTLLLSVFVTISSFAQGINFTYQGWSNLEGTNNLSLYIARDGFRLGSAFNDQNYPIWYVENAPISINNGVINYRIKNVSLDSLAKYHDQLFVYVAINGMPYDTIMLDPAPYAGYAVASGRSLESIHSNSSNESRHSVRSDSAREARHAINADTANYARTARVADSSFVSRESMVARHAYSSDYSTASDSSRISRSTYHVNPGGVELLSILATGAEPGAILTTNGTELSWSSSTKISGKYQISLIPVNTIDNDIRTFIFRVAQDIECPAPNAQEGKVITIVNSSTANLVVLRSAVWNMWGGDVVIMPRNSATMLYAYGQWVVINQ